MVLRLIKSALLVVFRLVAAFTLTAASAGTLLGVAGAATYSYFSRDLPEPSRVPERHQFQTTKIYDRNGVLLHEIYDSDRGKRIAVPLKRVPQHVIDAFLAAEDARFYENPGVDVQAIARAFLNNISSQGEQITGASTITQQLIKNSLLTDERTLTRKIREAILALRLSERYDKDQVLEWYLNTVYLGTQAYGIQAAAETYFGKTVEQLTPAEGALLAGLPRWPSQTNPIANPEAAKSEQRRVLNMMIRHGYLSEEQAEQLAAETLEFQPEPVVELKAPHFSMWIREQLQAKYGKEALFLKGLEVTTTLDIRMQEMAELLVREHVAKLGRYQATDGALVAINPATGEIL
ncbi:MAG TPA: transglycosylase domain-containing protein, partial [Chloroflexota bacterium]|nr:transglycosylase domain-containing protein [Chloroflexota bacterium]